MPEVQSTNQSNGLLSQRFIEFVMLQAQQAAFSLGRIPHPVTGDTSVNLEAARIFIDHLEMLREKTRGNLSKEEETILNNILAELQLAFVQTSENPTPLVGTEVLHEAPVKAEDEEKKVDDESDHKKKFSKSYGE